MAYEPTNWKTGDVVTSAKLNKLEHGVAAGSGVLVVHSAFDESTEVSTLDKTWQEIFDAATTSGVVLDTDGVISLLALIRGMEVYFLTPGPLLIYTADSPDDYPHNYGK